MKRAIGFLLTMTVSWMPISASAVDANSFTADYHLTDDFADSGGDVSAPIGWPQGTRAYVYYLYSQLKSILVSARTLDADKFTDQEKVWLDQLIAKLPYFPASTNELTEANPEWEKYQETLQMVDPKTNPIFDVASGTHRVAVTQNTWGSIIYLNEFLFAGAFQVDPYFGKDVTTDFVSQVLTILVHEKVHHLGVLDDNAGSLDKFGSKVAESFLRTSSFLNFFKSFESLSFNIISLAENDQDCDQQKNRLIFIRHGVFDLTAIISRILRGHFQILQANLCKIKFSNPRSVGTPSLDLLYSPEGSVINHQVQIDFSIKHGAKIEHGTLEMLIGASDYYYGVFLCNEKPAFKFKVLSLQNKAPRLFQVTKSPTSIEKGTTANFQIKIPKTAAAQSAKLVLVSRNLLDFDWARDRALTLSAKQIQEVGDSLILDFTWDVPATTVRASVSPARLEINDSQTYFPQFVADYAVTAPLPESKGEIVHVAFAECSPPLQCEMPVDPKRKDPPWIVADWINQQKNTLIIKVKNFKDIAQIRLIGFAWGFERIPGSGNERAYMTFRGFQQVVNLSESTPLVKFWNVTYTGDIATVTVHLTQPLDHVAREFVIEKLILIDSSESAASLYLLAKLHQI
ncbi:hypothetical protein [Bdellovibrio sp. HCB337]|uniref:hypothetical protein n=1 Tax=Bdellovibrio sp. HCB337 TaxID=3394358 RepID=UPI0039A71B14